ncbi:hypothetical protein [Herbaspirillum sp.]|nr:hypothetical protein [Herbaspirillum sp.]
MKFNDITYAALNTHKATPIFCLPAKQAGFPAYKKEPNGDNQQ